MQGRYEHRRCPLCMSIHPIGQTHTGATFAHRCDDTKSECAECGAKHDAYSSSSTGLSPCLAALTFEITEMKALIERFLAPNHVLEHGRDSMQRFGGT